MPPVNGSWDFPLSRAEKWEPRVLAPGFGSYEEGERGFWGLKFRPQDFGFRIQ